MSPSPAKQCKALLDLEKAFDRVPHELLWYALRQYLMSEELVCWVQLLYYDLKNNVRSVAGLSNPLRVFAGIHQGSALSPFLFVLDVDTVIRDIQRPAPHADDVFLASNSKNDLEQLVQKWNDRLMQNGLRLNLNKTEFLTTDSHEISTITVRGSNMPRTQYYQTMENCVMNLLHALTQPG